AVRGHSRKQNVARRGQLRVRFEERDLGLAGPPLNLLAQPRRARVDVVRADAGDARAAQPPRDMEPSFAETDKADPYPVVHRRNKIATEAQRHRGRREGRTERKSVSLFSRLSLHLSLSVSVSPWLCGHSKSELQAVLKLERIRGVARR